MLLIFFGQKRNIGAGYIISVLHVSLQHKVIEVLHCRLDFSFVDRSFGKAMLQKKYKIQNLLNEGQFRLNLINESVFCCLALKIEFLFFRERQMRIPIPWIYASW